MIACSEQNSRPSVQSEEQAYAIGFKTFKLFKPFKPPPYILPRDAGEDLGGATQMEPLVPEIYALGGTADIAGMFVDEGLT